jgi:anti-sigma regulatory factor (Ser/Thr protein kinase)
LDPKYKDRIVTVYFEKLIDKVVLKIEDQGNGFDWEKYMSMQAMSKNAFKSHGRGIFMANRLSFDALRYLGKGNIVEMEILRSS